MAAYNLSVNALKIGALKSAGELTDGTSQYDTFATDYLNKAYLAVLSGSNEFEVDCSEPFSWAKQPTKGNIVLQPNYTRGTCAFTNGSANITFSTIPLNQNAVAISLAGYWVQVAGVSEWFKILTHVSGTTVGTIYSVYTDTTNLTASINAVPLEYDLNPTNGILRLISPLEVYRTQDQMGDQEGKVYFTDEVTLLKQDPMFLLRSGTPTLFTIIAKDEAGKFTIRFNRYVTIQTKIEYNWVKIPDILTDATNVFPKVPVDHRLAMQYMATYWLCNDKNDSRKQDYFNLTQRALKAMIIADGKEKIQSSKARGQLIPRGDNYSRSRGYFTQEVS